MKTKLTLFLAVIAVALFGMGCLTHDLSNMSDSALSIMANDGNPDAQNELGNRLRSEHPDENAKAAIWYSKAANQGYAEAQNNLGELIDKGYTGQRDDDNLAQAWYIISAKNGSKKGEKNRIEHSKEEHVQPQTAKDLANNMISKNPLLIKK